jgi:LysR family glycine cleavage system transcriptional activator
VPRRLPALTALRAFEAAGRVLSFTRAADELNVTQAAVSHQIKTLEDQLGVALFKRVHRGLLLTDAGQALLQPMTRAFDIMAEAVDDLNTRRRSDQINLSTLDSLAASWLLPRLLRFRLSHPDVDIRVSTSERLIDLAADGFDLGIRYGPGTWPRVDAVRLMTEEMFPVCAPALLNGDAPLRTPADLAHVTLLHDDMTEDWTMWLDAAGVSDIDVTRGLAFTHSNLVTQAAKDGAGVALGRSVLVQEDLDAGRLVQPFDLRLPAFHAYWIVTPKGATPRKEVRAFIDWLMEEAGTGPAPSDSALAADTDRGAI